MAVLLTRLSISFSTQRPLTASWIALRKEAQNEKANPLGGAHSHTGHAPRVRSLSELSGKLWMGSFQPTDSNLSVAYGNHHRYFHGSRKWLCDLQLPVSPVRRA